MSSCRLTTQEKGLSMRVQWGEGIIWPLGRYNAPLPPQIGSGSVMEAWQGWVRSCWPVSQMFPSKPATTPVSISLPSVPTLPTVSTRNRQRRKTNTLPKSRHDDGEMNEQTASSFCSDSPHLGGPHTGDPGTDKGERREMKETDMV